MKKKHHTALLALCCCAIAGSACAQATFRYYLFDETKTGTLHYELVHDFAIYHFEKAKPSFHFNVNHRIYGLNVTNFSYATERLSGQLDSEKCVALLDDVRKLDVAALTNAPSVVTNGVSGWIDLDGKNYYVKQPLSNSTRKALHDLLLSFLDDVRPEMKKTIVTQTISGELATPIETSLAELIETPEKFDGKRVRVRGYHHSEFEHSSLSDGPESIRKYKQSVWLGSFSSFANLEDVVSQNNSFMTVEGTYKAGPGGHLGLWPGAITRLTKIEVHDDK